MNRQNTQNSLLSQRGAPQWQRPSLFRGRAPRTLLLSVLILSIVLSLFSSTFASAKTVAQMNPTEQTKSWLYYNALSACIKDQQLSNTNGDRISVSNANAGKWFSNGDPLTKLGATNPTIGYFLTGAGLELTSPGEKVGCGGDNVNWITDAANLWGYSSPIHLLCDTGARRVNKSDCVDGSEGFTGVNTTWLGATNKLVLDTFQNNIKNKVYAGKDPSRNDAAQYTHYRNAFFVGCLGKASPSPYTGAANDSFVYTVDVVDASGNKTSTKYYGAKKASDSIGFSISPNTNNISETCGNLASKVNEFASSYALWVKTYSTSSEDEASGDDVAAEETASSCTIEGVGWILCPIVKSLAGIADGAFIVISDSFLRTSVSIVDTQGPTYAAWSQIRTVSNVIFVIVFLFIIFSQLTGTGVSNYGIKKLLPRLVISAILVNVSFVICQLLVDFSNILGYSINDLISDVSKSVTKHNVNATQSFFSSGNSLSDVTVGVIAFAAGAAAVYALLSTLLPVLLAAVVALVMILFILVARQALIVLLIVLAPLAFVAYLLPNTERFFTQWRKTFLTLLLVFPIISLIFGMSQLASGVVTSAFTLDSSSIIDGASSAQASLDKSTMTDWFGQIIGAAILVLPLFVVPSLLKKSLDSVPMVGQLANKWSGRANSRVGGKMKESYRGSMFARGAAIRKGEREKFRTRRFAEKISQDGKIGRINQAVAQGIRLTEQQKVAGNKMLQSAEAATIKAAREDVDDAKKIIANQNFNSDERQQLAMEGSIVVRGKTYGGKSLQQAAIEMQVAGAGGYGGMHEIINASSGKLSEFSQVISQGALSAGSKDPAYSGKRIDSIAQNQFNYEESVLSAMKEGRYTAEAFAGMHDNARENAIQIARKAEANGDSSYINALRSAASAIETSSELRARIAGNNTASAQLASLKEAANPTAAVSPVQTQASTAPADQDGPAPSNATNEGPVLTVDRSAQAPTTDTPPSAPTPPSAES